MAASPNCEDDAAKKRCLIEPEAKMTDSRPNQMALRAGVLIALWAGSAVANSQTAATQGSSSDEVQPLRTAPSPRR